MMPMTKQSDPNGQIPFRILSLSGGGARGIYQAIFLDRLKAYLSKPLREHFDLIAGTSTGAIVAAAVACEVDLTLVERLYRTQSPLIFEKKIFAKARPGPQYDVQTLKGALTAVFGDRRLRDCKSNVIIPSTVLDDFGLRVFTNIEESSNGDLDANLVDILLSTSAAPTYFPPAKLTSGDRSYVDGGLWANSPCLIGVVEASQRLGIAYERIRVVSVGNGRSPVGKIGSNFSKLRTIDPEMIGSVYEMMFETQSNFAHYLVGELIGRRNILHVNSLTTELISLDDAKRANELLPPLAEKQAAQVGPALSSFLGTATVKSGEGGGGGGILGGYLDKFRPLNAPLRDLT
jgi:hypothetical protein